MASKRLPNSARLNRVATADGGILTELYKIAGWGQLTMRVIPPGVTVGGHRHPNTDEWWLVARGEAKVTLMHGCGARQHNYLYEFTPKVIKVQRGVFHWLENTGETEVVLLFYSSRIYDPDAPDKEIVSECS